MQPLTLTVLLVRPIVAVLSLVTLPRQEHAPAVSAPEHVRPTAPGAGAAQRHRLIRSVLAVVVVVALVALTGHAEREQVCMVRKVFTLLNLFSIF